MIYKVTVTTPYGKFIVAINTKNAEFAEVDAKEAAQSHLHHHTSMTRIMDVSRSNRRILADMEPAHNCVSYNQDGKARQWAWIKKTN